MKLCCKNVDYFLKNKRDVLKYNDKFREYYIKNHSHSDFSIICMSFCPFCGKAFPENLRRKFFDVLEKEYKLEVSIGELHDNEKIPEEFKTDEWWKKRGL